MSTLVMSRSRIGEGGALGVFASQEALLAFAGRRAAPLQCVEGAERSFAMEHVPRCVSIALGHGARCLEDVWDVHRPAGGADGREWGEE